jgi:hypothetical protein
LFVPTNIIDIYKCCAFVGMDNKNEAIQYCDEKTSKERSTLEPKKLIFKMYTGLADLGYGYISGSCDYCNIPSNSIT